MLGSQLRYRLSGKLLAVVCACCANAQSPNVSFSADINPQVLVSESGEARLRWYDDTGEFSRIRLGLILDNGLHVRFFQKLGKIPNDADVSSADELYIERPGDWRVGKQYIPFGTGRVLKESVIGASVETHLAFLDLPIHAMAIENGPRRQSGFVARVGDNLGVSFGIGEHFGINGSALTQIRRPEDSPGKGRGYDRVFGADVSVERGGWGVSAEWVRLSEGSSNLDAEEDVIDVVLSYQFPFGPRLQLEAAQALRVGESMLRFSADIAATERVFLVPSIRVRPGSVWEYSIAARIRL